MLHEGQQGEGDMVKAIGAIVLLCGLVACGAQQRSAAPAMAAPEAAAEAGSPMPPSAREQIEQLEEQIKVSRIELELEEPSEASLEGVPAQPLALPPSSEDPKCRPAPTETCKTSCTLSDSICDNAQKICKIAEEMAGDGWAMGRCAKANKTCESSRAKCCGCQ